jgi:cytochrome P450 / NADPH-cytochrome P450 reductase
VPAPVSLRPKHNVKVFLFTDRETGLAPFRGFIQERAAQIGAGRVLAPALLFFGCHSGDTDDLYADELAKWEKMGAVDIRRAYSRAPDQTGSCKHAQDRMWADRKEVIDLWERGGKVFVCGSSELGEGVRDVSLRMVRERHQEKTNEELSIERAEAWFDRIRNDRFATDVFA